MRQIIRDRNNERDHFFKFRSLHTFPLFARIMLEVFWEGCLRDLEVFIMGISDHTSGSILRSDTGVELEGQPHNLYSNSSQSGDKMLGWNLSIMESHSM